MTTKSPFFPLFALLMTTMLASADMTSHSPANAVQYARDIAVGVVKVSREKGLEVLFTPQTILKGSMQPGSTYTINYDVNLRSRLSGVVDKIAAYAEGKPAIMFVGLLLPDGRTISPDSFDGAIWPRATKVPLYQTPDTLEDCILFVKALLANPKLKLKRVNKRDSLPDGYTLPANHADAVQPDDETRVLSYRSPAVTVHSATDVAVGVVQVNHVNEVASAQVYRNNGLEIKFIPKTVLKGSMKPGATYNVDYPLGRMYYRDYLPKVVTAVEGKPEVMLLGRLHSDSKTFELEGLDSAVWPRSNKWGGVFQTPDTLEGCITFVKALIASPDLKLKIVNDRQMLPDGYTLPLSSSGTIKPGEAPPVTPKAP